MIKKNKTQQSQHKAAPIISNKTTTKVLLNTKNKPIKKNTKFEINI